MTDVEQNDNSMIFDDISLNNINDSMLMESLRSTIQKHSKANQKQEEQDDNPVGTPYYLAPEIWKDKQYSKESDIWALGVILYELLCFKKPFPANDKEELIKKVFNNPYDKIRQGVSASF